MNKLITDYIDTYSLELNVKGLIINSKEYSVYNTNVFPIEELPSIIEKVKENNFLVFLNINKIIEEDEIKDFFLFIKRISYDIDYFIYSDYSVLTICEELGISNDKLIYDSKTLVSSSFEAMTIKTKTFISHELNIEEIKTIVKINNKICLDIYGYHPIMYSRRPLLSVDGYEKNICYDLKEETRTRYYKIYEDNNGTYIYSKAKYFLSKELKDIVSNVIFLRINTFHLEKEELIKVITFYNKYLETFDETIRTTFMNETDNLYTSFLYETLHLLGGEEND